MTGPVVRLVFSLRRQMVYALEADQVTFVIVGTETEVTVTWADLGQTEAA